MNQMALEGTSKGVVVDGQLTKSRLPTCIKSPQPAGSSVLIAGSPLKCMYIIFLSLYY